MSGTIVEKFFRQTGNKLVYRFKIESGMEVGAGAVLLYLQKFVLEIFFLRRCAVFPLHIVLFRAWFVMIDTCFVTPGS